MSDPATPTGGPEHDAWLREALRHAPDASAAPPLSLREAILAEARAATRAGPRTASPASVADRFAGFWSWLARPPVAAGFASVMAATLVGLMWWDRPLDEMTPPPPEPVAAARAPAPEAARPTPAPAAAPPLDERAAAADRAERRGIVATPPSPPPAAVAEPPTRAKAADALRDQGKDADADARASTAAPAATVAAPAAAAAPTAQAAPKVQSSPSPFPARDPRDSDTQAQPPARAERPALAKKVEKSEAEEKRRSEVAQNTLGGAAPATTGAAPTGRLEPSADAATGSVAAGRFTTAPTPAPMARQRAAEVASATPRPMAPLLAALANDGGRWSRSTAAGETVVVDAAAQAWLGRVDAAASPWQAASDRLSRLDGTAVASADANTMLLYREGRIAAIVRIDDAGVTFETRPGSAWFAALPPDVAARLRATLPAATR